MSDPLKRTGSCLCGAVSFEATLKSNHVDVCHCSMCRKWGGGPAIGLQCERDIQLKGENYLTWYKSSDWAERGFCNKCGSNLFCRVKEEVGDYFGIFASSLDNQDGLELTQHIFIDNKPEYYDFADHCERLTEAQFLAQFAESEG